jgi:hypothetical protein
LIRSSYPQGFYFGHGQIGTAATFLGVSGTLVMGECIGSARVLLLAKYARGLRDLNR